MGLTANTATALLALNGLDICPNSGPMNATNLNVLRDMLPWLRPRPLGYTGVVDEEEVPDMAREFAYGLAKRAYGFQREPVGMT